MNVRVSTIHFNGVVAERHEADDRIRNAGDAVLVHRGVARSIVLRCPDGCGDELTINLDARTGPAWKHYLRAGELTIYPSVWRESGCGSHFIIWNSRIFWCDWDVDFDEPSEVLSERVQAELTQSFRSYLSIADALELLPWDVLAGCRMLQRAGIAQSGIGDQRHMFRKAPKK